jgi:hypothetical protein
MLAQNFKTAAELRITERQFSALAQTLGHLERNQIAANNFTMADTGSPDFWAGAECRTPACICGWARHFAKENIFRRRDRTQELNNLFLMGADTRTCQVIGDRPFSIIGIPQAAIALRSYLTNGEPRWEEALA